MNAPIETALALTPALDMPRRWDVLGTSHDVAHMDDNAKPLPFVEAAAQVMARHAADGRRRDVRGVNLAGCTVIDQDRVPTLVTPDGDELGLRGHAFGQLCGLVGAGRARPYLEQLPAPIALDALRWSLRDQGADGVTLRIAGDEVRAVVSDRYAPLDDRAAMGEVFRYLRDEGTLDDYEVCAMATGKITNLRVVRRDPIDGPDGHGLQVGFDLRNSELGGASLLVRAVVYRIICTNGALAATAKAETRWRHIGDPARMHEGLVASMPAVLAEAYGEVNRYKAAHDVRLNLGEARAHVGRLDLTAAQRRLVLSEAVVESGVLDATEATDAAVAALPEQTEMTMWHLVNGVTGAAREVGSTTGRLAMEREAGVLLARAA